MSYPSKSQEFVVYGFNIIAVAGILSLFLAV